MIWQKAGMGMLNEKERAYRYDLFISSDWRERFDSMVDDEGRLPNEGRILELNCGTGAYSTELAARLGKKGEVVGIDPIAERVEIARAKAQVQKIENVTFLQGNAVDLPFAGSEFDAVMADGSMTRANEIEDVLAEMLRVAQPDARLVLKLTTHGSFDEFFSIYWEAMQAKGLVDHVWSELEALIKERLTISDLEQLATSAGLRHVETFCRKEEFQFEDADEFLNAPLVGDHLLEDWLDILPEGTRDAILREMAAIIDRERSGAPFDLSIKATLLVGVK
ncbi:MAG TPA: methyltransferase domain-containing protein [Blastocatellia bacterium]|nr:methyltransferase domain-containing protein [Blastocatellia bacterium]